MATKFSNSKYLNGCIGRAQGLEAADDGGEHQACHYKPLEINRRLGADVTCPEPVPYSQAKRQDNEKVNRAGRAGTGNQQNGALPQKSPDNRAFRHLAARDNFTQDFLHPLEVGKLVHEGNGTQQLIIEKGADDKQHEALPVLSTTKTRTSSGLNFVVYNAMNSKLPGLVVSNAEPIRNPVTVEGHRALIVLLNGCKYTVAETGSASSKLPGEISQEFPISYAWFNELHMTQ